MSEGNHTHSRSCQRSVKVPAVSILVAAWNEGEFIGRCLASLAALDWPELEILVAASGDDGTIAEARRFVGERVHVVEQRPHQGKQVALRALLALARSEVIYFTGGDCTVSQRTFDALLAPIVAAKAVATAGAHRPHPEALGDPLCLY